MNWAHEPGDDMLLHRRSLSKALKRARPLSQLGEGRKTCKMCGSMQKTQEVLQRGPGLPVGQVGASLQKGLMSGKQWGAKQGF